MVSTATDYPPLQSGDRFAYNIQFCRWGQWQTWIQYHRTDEEARDAANAAIQREFPEHNLLNLHVTVVRRSA